MKPQTRFCIAAATLASMFGLIHLSLAGGPADLSKAVKKIAADIKDGKGDAAKKLAAATAKNPKLIDEIADLMHMYRPVTKGGLGIENDLKKVNAKNAAELGNLVNAMAELTLAKGWEKNQGKRTKKAWNDFTEEMQDASIRLAKAKNANDAKSYAEKVTGACNRCHSVFKD